MKVYPQEKSPEDNVVVAEHGKEVHFDFSPKPHWDLARQHDIIDWELGVKITGAGFPVYKGEGGYSSTCPDQFLSG